MAILWLGQEEGKDKECAEHRDFPGDRVVKTSPSKAEAAGSIPGWGDDIPHASCPKHQNMKQKHIEPNSIETLKMIHIKRKKKILKKIKMTRMC